MTDRRKTKQKWTVSTNGSLVWNHKTKGWEAKPQPTVEPEENTGANSMEEWAKRNEGTTLYDR